MLITAQSFTTTQRLHIYKLTLAEKLFTAVCPGGFSFLDEHTAGYHILGSFPGGIEKWPVNRATPMNCQ